MVGICAHHLEYLLDALEYRTILFELDKAASMPAVEAGSGVYHYTTCTPWKIGIYVKDGRFRHVNYVQYKNTCISWQQLKAMHPDFVKSMQRFRDNSLASKVFGLQLASV